jgi:hypothetical protein
MLSRSGRRFARSQHQLSHETPELVPERYLSDEKRRKIN